MIGKPWLPWFAACSRIAKISPRISARDSYCRLLPAVMTALSESFILSKKASTAGWRGHPISGATNLYSLRIRILQ